MLVRANRLGLSDQNHITFFGLILRVVDFKLASFTDQLLIKRVFYQPLDRNHGGFVHFSAQHNRRLYPCLRSFVFLCHDSLLKRPWAFFLSRWFSIEQHSFEPHESSWGFPIASWPIESSS